MTRPDLPDPPDLPEPPDPDPTRVLDGWKPAPGRADAGADPTRVLDGWRPSPNPAAAPPFDPQPQWPAAPHAAAPAPLPDALDLRTPLRASKWKTDDVTDVDAVWRPSAAVRQAALDATATPDDPDWQPSQPGLLARALPPRVLAGWKPQAWIGAVRPVFGAVAQVLNTEQGPVVDTFAPHLLLALWPPQTLQHPFLDRWPQRVLLSAVARDDAPRLLLELIPPDAELWLAEHDLDWALIGEAVLLHEPGLRDFQLKELRAFVDGQRQATWERVNRAYRLPATGQALERL